jgi:hypothetical protein
VQSDKARHYHATARAQQCGIAGLRRPAPRKREGECLMAEGPRLRSLEERHAALERQIGEEDARPKPDEAALTRLKLEKLRLKEEIERLRRGD